MRLCGIGKKIPARYIISMSPIILHNSPDLHVLRIGGIKSILYRIVINVVFRVICPWVTQQHGIYATNMNHWRFLWPPPLPFFSNTSGRSICRSISNLYKTKCCPLIIFDLIRLLKKFPNLVQHAVAPREYTRSKVNVELLEILSRHLVPLVFVSY